MEYSLQHNGKGKYHLLDSECEPLCKTKVDLNFTATSELEIRGGEYYEVNEIMGNKSSIKLTKEIIENCYCKKCIKSAK